MQNSIKAALTLGLETACMYTQDVRFLAEYSGRGMYGEECVGLVGSIGDCQRVLVDVVKSLGDQLVESAKCETQATAGDALELFNAAVEVVFDYRQDSMGYDSILYWPSLSSEAVPA